MTESITLIKEKIWIITDTHFGHKKMIEYCGRPENHSELILERLGVIPFGAILIHLGDICIGRDAYWHEMFQKATEEKHLRKILLKRNHDGKTKKWYVDHGWDEVHDQMILEFPEGNILLSHTPEVNTSVILSRRENNEIEPVHLYANIHGHFHNKNHRLDESTKTFYDPSFHWKLSVEETNYYPVKLVDFISWNK